MITITCNMGDLCPNKCWAGHGSGWEADIDTLMWLKERAVSFTDTELIYDCGELNHVILEIHEQQEPGVCDSIW